MMPITSFGYQGSQYESVVNLEQCNSDYINDCRARNTFMNLHPNTDYYVQIDGPIETAFFEYECQVGFEKRSQRVLVNRVYNMGAYQCIGVARGSNLKVYKMKPRH